MAGVDPDFVMYGGQPPPTLTVAPGGRNAPSASSMAVQPHHGLIGLVLLAVVVLAVLDKAGFRFAVTVGKR